ncbi:MAG: isoleucine--tRNA ligase [Defluviitaleaceae bacterium]|nr:isoleucine--tRNA ligase [Defluviitaleaceae bacterium]
MPTNTKPDFIKMEQNILSLWDEGNHFDKLRNKNAQGKRFRFLDGPITANNPMGIHHAWGRSTKDIFIRYKAMNGYSCHYKNGFDAQGLWVEVEVEKELGFKDKKDIEAYGMGNFTRKCVERIQRFSAVITQQSKRLGQWMDWENSYYTHTDENITAIWHFLKICHTNGWITKAYKPMPWCPRCGTSLSEHEMSGSYKEITHTAVFAIANMKNADFDMLVWTTTPWTLSANMALAVNPELDYALVQCEGLQRPIVMAKNAIKHVEGDKQVLRILKGDELVGLEYEAFFPWLAAQQEVTHTVIPWDDVGADEGSGIVHIAPGCGAEDYELGKKFSIAEICPIDESGVFVQGYGFLEGQTASQAASLIFTKLHEQGKLYKTHEYTHSYPVCWRCKTEVLFRLVREWYIKTKEIKPQLIQAANTVRWEPSFIGKRMLDWLNNMGDWNISRKRFYGLPLPFYPCESCEHLTVIGSKDELVAMAGTAANSLPELHRPWIDEVTITCTICGSTVSRIPEVGDVWLDAGIVPYSTLGYFTDMKQWEQNFPAEWVIEMQEQVRLWFYSQLFMSVTLTGKAPYQFVQTNNWVLAEDGTKFSKTGNMIRFEEAADKIGADAVRYLFASASMVNDVRFGFNLGEDARRKLLGFWNIYTFFMTYAEIDRPEINVNCYNSAESNLSDKWLASRVSAFVSKAVKGYENYSTPEVVREFETCVDDVSNWYVRINRKRFWKEGSDADKQSAYNTLYSAIKEIAQIMAPIIPFMTEHIWQSMVRVYEPVAEESIHLSSFPCVRSYDMPVLSDVEKVRSDIALALKLRNENNLKIKQPLSILYLEKSCEALSAYEPVIRSETNIKEIVYLSDFDNLSHEYVALNFQVAGRVLKSDLNKVKALCDDLTPTENDNIIQAIKHAQPVLIDGYSSEIPADCFVISKKDKKNIARLASGVPVAINTEITHALKAEGLYREILRHCQLLRKEAGFVISDRVALSFESKSETIQAVLATYAKDIERETLSVIKCISAPAPKTVMHKEIALDDGVLGVYISDIGT